MNVKILALKEAGRYAEAAAAWQDDLMDSERIVSAVYARRAPENSACI